MFLQFFVNSELVIVGERPPCRFGILKFPHGYRNLFGSAYYMILSAVLVRVDFIKTVYNDYQLKVLAAVLTFVNFHPFFTLTFNNF